MNLAADIQKVIISIEDTNLKWVDEANSGNTAYLRASNF